MQIKLEEPSKPISVQITYKIRIDSKADQIPVRAIADESIAILNPRAIIQGRAYDIDLRNINQRVTKGNILGLQLQEQDSPVEITVRYELHGLDLKKKKAKALIPVLFIDWRPAEASAEAFSALVQLPKNFSLSSIFPAMIWKKNATTELNEYSFDLQTIPAWVRFNLYEGQIPFFSIELLVDLGVILALIILMAIGWKKLRNG